MLNYCILRDSSSSLLFLFFYQQLLLFVWGLGSSPTTGQEPATLLTIYNWLTTSTTFIVSLIDHMLALIPLKTPSLTPLYQRLSSTPPPPPFQSLSRSRMYITSSMSCTPARLLGSMESPPPP